MLLPGLQGAGVRSLVRGIREAQLEPVSVVASWTEADRFDVAVRFEGFRAGVVEQRARLTALVCGQAGRTCEALGPPAASAFWARHESLRTAAPLRARLALLPSGIEPVSGQVLPELLSSLDEPGFLWYATLGLGFLSGTPRDAGSASAAIDAARGRVARLGGTLTLDAAPAEIRERVDVWGPAPDAQPLMRSMKERLDPQRRLSPGRLAGGI